jgi:carbon-monoxide dehydrogenase large subunit
MPGSLLGNAVRRVEDPDLLAGRAAYVDDLPIDGALQLAFVRSPIAHATIRSVDASDALTMPGVVAVFTADDLALSAVPAFMQLNPACERPPLARGTVNFVGDPVAVVVAESKAAAVDAAELVVVDYDPLPVAVDPEAALDPSAPVQIEALGSNLGGGRREGSADPLAGADVVIRGRFENQRVAAVPMEGNAIAVVPGRDGDAHALTVYVATQMPHRMWADVAEVTGLDAADVRVVAPYVGGGFGAKAGMAAEHDVAIACARRLGRPVKWIETRSENLLSMPHGRGQVQYIEMGFTHDGEIVGLRCRMVGDAGAYGGFGGMLVMSTTRMMAQGVYRIPKIAYETAVAITNTTPMGAFRGAGRPEAAAFLERIIDMAADELDIDPVELRRRNFLRPEQFPFSTLMGPTYDNGEYDGALTEALRLAGYDELRAEQARRRERGDPCLLGIGVSAYVEVTAMGGNEFAGVEVHEDATVTVRVGTSGHGQGHPTSFAMIVADRLGVPLHAVRLVQSDTAHVPRGGGTGGSRSLQLGGSAVVGATDAVLAKAREHAARLLEASVDDIVVTDDGRVGVAGVPARALSWAELAVAASDDGDPLAAEFDFSQSSATFPFGAHVAVVEIDSETGRVAFLRHVAVDDCGRVLNPLLVTGQQHGGVAQGAAQALYEQVVFDVDGNPLTANLADYAMPSAAELPSFESANTQTPTHLNPLGAKGIGESGTIGSTPAVQNAVVDALSHLGIRHLDMPCTPERVWRAIRDARAGSPPPAWREPPAVFVTIPAPGAAAPTEQESAELDL